MGKTEVLVAHNRDTYNIKVSGRATFAYGTPLRHLAQCFENEEIARINVDLSECTGMDSTFMGILAMLGLRAKKNNAEVEIINADTANVGLLDGLGLHRLFKFSKKTPEELKQEQKWESASDKTETQLDMAKTVYDAHDTLMGVDPGNIPKFKGVVDMAKKDLDKLEEKEKSGK